MRWKYLTRRQEPDSTWRTICYDCEALAAMRAAGVTKPVKGIDKE